MKYFLLVAFAFISVSGFAAPGEDRSPERCLVAYWQLLDQAFADLEDRADVSDTSDSGPGNLKMEAGCDPQPFFTSILKGIGPATKPLRFAAAEGLLDANGDRRLVELFLQNPSTVAGGLDRKNYCRLLLHPKISKDLAGTLLDQLEKRPFTPPFEADCLRLRLRKLRSPAQTANTLLEGFSSESSFVRNLARETAVDLSPELPGDVVTALVDQMRLDLQRTQVGDADAVAEVTGTLRALKGFKTRARGAGRQVARFLDSPDDRLAAAALSTLAVTNPQTPEFHAAVKSHLSHRSSAVRYDAEMRLKEMGPAAREYLKLLLPKLNETEIKFEELSLVSDAALTISEYDGDVARKVREVLRTRRESTRDPGEAAEISSFLLSLDARIRR